MIRKETDFDYPKADDQNLDASIYRPPFEDPLVLYKKKMDHEHDMTEFYKYRWYLRDDPHWNEYHGKEKPKKME